MPQAAVLLFVVVGILHGELPNHSAEIQQCAIYATQHGHNVFMSSVPLNALCQTAADCIYYIWSVHLCVFCICGHTTHP